MQFEKSCGAVVFHKAGERIEYLLLKHLNGNHWGFPKGHVEAGETETQTALREINEEVGLRVDLVAGFRHKTEYSPKENIWKEVIYFIGETRERQFHCQAEEVAECRWVAYAPAMELLSFENSKILLRQANQFLTNQAQG